MPDYHTLCLDRIVRFISTSMISSARRIVGTTQSGGMLRIRALRATVKRLTPCACKLWVWYIM